MACACLLAPPCVLYKSVARPYREVAHLVHTFPLPKSICRLTHGRNQWDTFAIDLYIPCCMLCHLLVSQPGSVLILGPSYTFGRWCPALVNGWLPAAVQQNFPEDRLIGALGHWVPLDPDGASGLWLWNKEVSDRRPFADNMEQVTKTVAMTPR